MARWTSVLSYFLLSFGVVAAAHWWSAPWRSRLDREALRLTVVQVARVGALFALGGVALQLVRGDRWLLTAPFTFGLPPLVAAALLAAAALSWRTARRRREAFVALALAVGVGLWALGRDYRAGACPRPAPGTTVRLLTWNVGHQLDGETAERLRRSAAEHVVLVEADGVDRRRWSQTLPGHQVCAPGGGVMVLSRRPIRSCRRHRLGPRSHAVLASLEGGTVRWLIAVDVDGHPLANRRRPLEAIAELARGLDGGAVIAGDFNTPRRAWSFDPLRRGHRDAFAVAGRGWAGSWPAPLPLLDIDHVWVPESVEARCASFLPAAGSDHRPLIVDLAPAAARTRRPG